MNEFEIKTAKQNLKDLGLLEIYKISQKYNEEEYGGRTFDIVIEYVYKNEKYLTFCSPTSYELKDKNKIEVVEIQIKKHMKEIQVGIFDNSKNEDISIEAIEDVVGVQMECWYVKNEESISHEDFNGYMDQTKEAIEELAQEGMGAKEIYKKVLKAWRDYYIDE